MNIKLEIVKRDKFCNYCNVSEYRDNWDNRKVYQLRTTNNQNTMIVNICQKCLEDLAYLINLLDA